MRNYTRTTSSNARTYPMVCDQCGKVFVSATPRGRFCCPGCKVRWHNARKKKARAEAAEAMARLKAACAIVAQTPPAAPKTRKTNR